MVRYSGMIWRALIGIFLAFSGYLFVTQGNPMQAFTAFIQKPCSRSLTYKIGTVDEDFGLSRDEIVLALKDAEAVWEKPSGIDLFSYDENGSVVINFVYDDRQYRSEQGKAIRGLLGEGKSEITSAQERYDSMAKEYQSLVSEYEGKQNTYANELSTYNSEVNTWNEKGGAPAEVYEKLEKESSRLEKKRTELQEMVDEIKSLAVSLNTFARETSISAEKYNDIVKRYNEVFRAGELFAQGDYSSNVIHIYQYSNGDDLRLVLAHEMGHALGLGHVMGDTSIMYERMGQQELALGVSKDDLTHLSEICQIAQ